MRTLKQGVLSQPGKPVERFAGALLRVGWKTLTFPLLAVLIILEPVVRVVLASLALLLVLGAFFWKFGAPPALHVPFVGLLGAAVMCIAVLVAYYWLLRALSA